MKDDIELLSAYLDDELSKSERSILEVRLKNEPELAEQLQCLKANDDAIRGVFNCINNDPLPNSIMELLENEYAQTQVRSPSKKRHWYPLAGAAACIALAVAFTLNSKRAETPRDALQHTLSHTVSGEREGNITTEFSFLTTDKKLCRQYISASTEKNTRSISCHSVDGWKEVARFEIKNSSNSEHYIPAGSQTDPLDAFISEHISGAPLSATEEKEALSKTQ